nr:MAG TPA: hypothetical protein [Caudoviricetes sp.]
MSAFILPFRGAGTRPQALKNGLFLLGREPIISKYTGGTYYDIGRIV